jgi:hypothetical protein
MHRYDLLENHDNTLFLSNCQVTGSILSVGCMVCRFISAPEVLVASKFSDEKIKVLLPEVYLHVSGIQFNVELQVIQ